MKSIFGKSELCSNIDGRNMYWLFAELAGKLSRFHFLEIRANFLLTGFDSTAICFFRHPVIHFFVYNHFWEIFLILANFLLTVRKYVVIISETCWQTSSFSLSCNLAKGSSEPTSLNFYEIEMFVLNSSWRKLTRVRKIIHKIYLPYRIGPNILFCRRMQIDSLK